MRERGFLRVRDRGGKRTQLTVAIGLLCGDHSTIQLAAWGGAGGMLLCGVAKRRLGPAVTGRKECRCYQIRRGGAGSPIGRLACPGGCNERWPECLRHCRQCRAMHLTYETN